jgi:hypothetical protein
VVPVQKELEEEQELRGEEVSAEERRRVVDALLLVHLLRALKYLVRDRDLPLLQATLWATVKK